MRIIVEELAHNGIDSQFEYSSNYSVPISIETTEEIYERIYSLEHSPYIGRYIPEISDKRFREIIYKKTKHSTYRIMYYISENTNTIHIFSVINSKQNFYPILKLHNYFKNYFNF